MSPRTLAYEFFFVQEFPRADHFHPRSCARPEDPDHHLHSTAEELDSLDAAVDSIAKLFRSDNRPADAYAVCLVNRIFRICRIRAGIGVCHLHGLIK